MHLITVTESVDLGKRFGVLAPGEYVVEDKNAFEIGLLAGTGKVTTWRYAESRDSTPRKVLIIRSGALGDLLLLTPAIRAYHEKYPDVQISLSCFEIHAELFEAASVFDSILPYPLDARELKKYDTVLSLEGLHESKTEHMTDAFAKHLGVTVTDYKVSYESTSEEKEWAANLECLKTPRRRLGIQMKSSSPNRDYPLGQWLQIIHGLEERGWAIYLFGLKGQLPPFPAQAQRPDIYDMSELDLNFRETSAVIEKMDAFLGIDSALLHIAGAFELPAIGLFGPFDWRLRIGKAPYTKAINGIGDCAPCGWHQKNGVSFPPGMRCSKEGYCNVLAGINPDRVIRKVDQLCLLHA